MMNGLKLMEARLNVRGGAPQQDRMIKDKRKTLDKAILYSYQGAKVRKLDSPDIAPALINPNQVKQDYDDKIISIGTEYGYVPGTLFEWVGTNTKWLIYLQDLTELAYFKGDIRRCSYEIKWEDNNGVQHSTYAAIRGPVETKIDSSIKEGNSLDTPNHTLSLLLPKNKDTLQYFKRYARFYLSGIAEGDEPICWRIEATDTLSMPGVLELTAAEYYINEKIDDVEQGIANGDLIKPEPPLPSDAAIEGEIFIRPKKEYKYTYQGEQSASWSYDTTLPIAATINGNEITIKWTTTYSGEFELKCNDAVKTIVVESLF